MERFRCPTEDTQIDGAPHTIIGCGAVFEAERDDEGLVDCPRCGIWFRPEMERNDARA